MTDFSLVTHARLQCFILLKPDGKLTFRSAIHLINLRWIDVPVLLFLSFFFPFLKIWKKRSVTTYVVTLILVFSDIPSAVLFA